jgi:hypothetical protein
MSAAAVSARALVGKKSIRSSAVSRSRSSRIALPFSRLFAAIPRPAAPGGRNQPIDVAFQQAELLLSSALK